MTFKRAMTILGAAAGVALLSGCASMPVSGGPDGREMISYSVGPCFGFCPVYSVSVTPAGQVSFNGERHTAVLGSKQTDGGASAYAAVAGALKAYRPATGTMAQTQCDQQMTDLSHYRIVWTAPDGTQTVLEHDKGCRSARNDKLNKALEALPERIGIADWAKQETRPGASRG